MGEGMLLKIPRARGGMLLKNSRARGPYLLETDTILTGMAPACVALAVMAFARQGWVVFAIMPVFALAGIGSPALQSLATRLVDESRQGQFQGVLASAVSLASIVGPLGTSTLYFVVQKQWPGAVWLSVVVVHAIAVPVVLSLRLRTGGDMTGTCGSA
jgi:DHA1 family tetracycline resistance protein-like MFS transporter